MAKRKSTKKANKKTSTKRPARKPNGFLPRIRDVRFASRYGAQDDKPRGGELWTYRGYTIDVFMNEDGNYQFVLYAPIAEDEPAFWWAEPDVEWIVQEIDHDLQAALLYDSDDPDQDLTSVPLYDLLGEKIESTRIGFTEEGTRFGGTFSVDYDMKLRDLEEKDAKQAERVQSIVYLTSMAIDRAKSRGADHLDRPTVTRIIEEARNDPDYEVRQWHKDLSDVPSSKALAYINDYLMFRAALEDDGDGRWRKMPRSVNKKSSRKTNAKKSSSKKTKPRKTSAKKRPTKAQATKRLKNALMK